MIKKIAIFIFVLFPQAHASELAAKSINLVSVKADMYPNDTFHIDIAVSETAPYHVEGLYFRGTNMPTPAYFSLSDLDHGATLIENGGYNAVVLQTNYSNIRRFEPAIGGFIQMKYLVSALKNKYGEVELFLANDKGTWTLRRLQENFLFEVYLPVTSMYMHSNKILGKTVGIKNVSFNTFKLFHFSKKLDSVLIPFSD